MVKNKVSLVARATKKILESIFKKSKTIAVLFLLKIIRNSVDGLDTSPFDLGNWNGKQRTMSNPYYSENIYVGTNKD